METSFGNVDMWVDWLDSDIPSAIRHLPHLLDGFPYKLITCVDSARDLGQVITILRIVRDFPRCKLQHGGLLIAGPGLPGIAETYGLFSGFDEMWFFPCEPVDGIQSDLWITGPLEIHKQVPEKLLEWMTASGCILGLGDGNGLNYVTTDRFVAESLEAFRRRSRV